MIHLKGKLSKCINDINLADILVEWCIKKVEEGTLEINLEPAIMIKAALIDLGESLSLDLKTSDNDTGATVH